MDSGEDSPRPTNRRRVDEDSDDDMLGNGLNRFGNGGGREEDEDEDQQQDLPAYELHRVQPDPFDGRADPYVVSDLESAKRLMESFALLFDTQHYQGEGYAGMIAKLFRLAVTESQPDLRDVVDVVFHKMHHSSAAEVAEHVKVYGCHTDSLIASIRAMFLPNKAHPDVQEMYEQNMLFLDTMSMTVSMHKFTLLSIIAQKAGDLKIMTDATISMKPFEELKDQVKLQKHLFRLFEEQKNRVYSDKVSLCQERECLYLYCTFAFLTPVSSKASVAAVIICRTLSSISLSSPQSMPSGESVSCQRRSCARSLCQLCLNLGQSSVSKPDAGKCFTETLWGANSGAKWAPPS